MIIIIMKVTLINSLDDDIQSMVEEKIKERNQAKENKNYELADSIRDELLSNGIKLIDTKDGTTYIKV